MRSSSTDVQAIRSPARPGFGSWLPTAPSGGRRRIERLPTHVAHDGSAQVYHLDAAQVSPTGKLQQASRLWASADGGLTWQERGQQFQGHVESLAVAEADAHVLYALTVDRP